MLLLLLPTTPSEVDEKGERYEEEMIAAARLCCCRAGARLNAYIHKFIVLSSLIKHQRMPAALKVENMVGHCFKRQNKIEQRHVTMYCFASQQQHDANIHPLTRDHTSEQKQMNISNR